MNHASGCADAALVAFAGGRGSEPTLLDDYLGQQAESQGPSFSSALEATSSVTIDPQSSALVFSRQGLDPTTLTQLETAFSFDKTLTQIHNTGSDTTPDTEQLLNSMLPTFNRTSQTNNAVEMALQPRFEADLSANALVTGGMQATAIFNRFDLAASDGSHCGEYRIVYHSVVPDPFLLIFEAQYPNPQPALGKAGCYPIADFWKQLGDMSDTEEALTKLEQFFYQGITHRSVNLPAVVNFNHYTDNTGQVRSNQFVDSPWQLREFKITLNAEGQPTFVLDTVKSNPLAELFKADQAADSDVLKTLRADFATDFISDYIDHLLAPELAGLPLAQATTLINSIHLNNDDRYNEFQSDAFGQDNTDQFTGLDALIEAELDARSDTLPGYTVDMIKTRAEAMSCGGCHKNASFKAIAPSIDWPRSNGFTHVNSAGNLSNALTERFLPGRADVLAAYLNDEANIPPEEPECNAACQLGSVSSYGGGVEHVCTIKQDNRVECWGNNGSGRATPPEGLLAKQVASSLHTSCAIKLDGSVTCWGSNSWGIATPPSDLMATQLAVGGSHACAIKEGGAIVCWGSNHRGMASPPQNLQAKQVTLSDAHTCALTTDNTVACWGYDGSGQTSVPSGLTAKQITIGRLNSCALTLDNTVRCWGKNYLGENTPPVGLIAKQVAKGLYHSCAIKLDDTVVCWGVNNYGQTIVPAGLVASKLVLGKWHTCAINQKDKVSCWGYNGYGQTSVPPELESVKQL